MNEKSLSQEVIEAETIDVTVSRRIFAHLKWQSAMLEVKKGQIINITASGNWSINPQHPRMYGPEGYTGVAPGGYVMPRIPEGALCARIGKGDPFHVGSFREFEADTNGDLQFIANDHPTHSPPAGFADNKGSVRVYVILK